jgi:hypothetical protein
MKVSVQHNNYLCELRDSGVTNMFGAAPYLQRRFGLSSNEAKDILLAWMQGDKHDFIHEEVNDESE